MATKTTKALPHYSVLKVLEPTTGEDGEKFNPQVLEAMRISLNRQADLQLRDGEPSLFLRSLQPQLGPGT
jgi:hypothetical protein